MSASVKDIRDELSCISTEDRKALVNFRDRYSGDERSGVRASVARAEKNISRLDREMERLEKMQRYENQYSEFKYICGIDEVGRGPLAGPVVTCAVILDPDDRNILWANDSKKLSAEKREKLDPQIRSRALAWNIGMADSSTIDEINILNATYEAMRQAVAGLSVKPDIMLNDAVHIPDLDIRQIPIVKGDASSVTIACASIVAKVYRDRMMKEYDRIYPQYGFAKNKGYGTEEHIRALKKYGPCPIHRRSFIGHFI